MKPKPFWPLNHFTTPVAILLSPKARIAPIARTTSVQAQIQSQRCLGEGGLGRDQQGSAFKSNTLHIQHSPAIARAPGKIPSPSAFLRSSLMQVGTDREAGDGSSGSLRTDTVDGFSGGGGSLSQRRRSAA